MAKFHALGRELSREQAYEVIIRDWIADVCEAGNAFGLRLLLLDGWTSLRARTDEDLQDQLDTVIERPLPGEEEADERRPPLVRAVGASVGPKKRGTPPRLLQ